MGVPIVLIAILVLVLVAVAETCDDNNVKDKDRRVIRRRTLVLL